MIYYVRHGQSLRNQTKQKYILQNLDIQEYLKGKRDQHNFDCGLSLKGIAQCIQLSKQVADYSFSLVLVSPLRRTLQTCDIILQTHSNSPKIIVEPLLTEILNSATNFGTSLEESMQLFPNFDFQKVKDNVHDWYVHLLRQEKRMKIMEQLKQEKVSGGRSVGRVVLGELKQGNQNLEVREDIEERAEKLQQVLREYRSTHQGNILIVGHSHITRSLCNSFEAGSYPNGELLLYNIEERSIGRV